MLFHALRIWVVYSTRHVEICEYFLYDQLIRCYVDHKDLLANLYGIEIVYRTNLLPAVVVSNTSRQFGSYVFFKTGHR